MGKWTGLRSQCHRAQFLLAMPPCRTTNDSGLPAQVKSSARTELTCCKAARAMASKASWTFSEFLALASTYGISCLVLHQDFARFVETRRPLSYTISVRLCDGGMWGNLVVLAVNFVADNQKWETRSIFYAKNHNIEPSLTKYVPVLTWLE